MPTGSPPGAAAAGGPHRIPDYAWSLRRPKQGGSAPAVTQINFASSGDSGGVAAVLNGPRGVLAAPAGTLLPPAPPSQAPALLALVSQAQGPATSSKAAAKRKASVSWGTPGVMPLPGRRRANSQTATESRGRSAPPTTDCISLNHAIQAAVQEKASAGSLARRALQGAKNLLQKRQAALSSANYEPCAYSPAPALKGFQFHTKHHAALSCPLAASADFAQGA
eukprot:TRINITY_DN18328_c0_g2_i3.p2 TRINITY_DN18328_c0_g2~~TRINITY_DN18328_c0_g2_i3.p2  ORF type:complete len:223 (+),score=40.69 TRINITY_DN18328_c0_g2_i3:539-1207(+)